MNWWQVEEREHSEWDIDIVKWMSPKPFGISGCFRLKDESEFMVKAVESHLPYLDEAVLVVQDSKDNTVELALELAKKHDKVHVYKYPVEPHFIDHPQFHTEPINSLYSFVYFSNWALSRCNYSWIAKTEGDVICLPTMENIVKRIHNAPTDWRYYGRVILNVAGANKDLISFDNPRNGGWDECVVPNDPNMAHFVRRSKWEVMDAPNIPAECMGWSAMHMKRCKQEFLPGPWNGERYVPFEPDDVEAALTVYNNRNGYPGPDNPLGIEELYEVRL